MGHIPDYPASGAHYRQHRNPPISEAPVIIATQQNGNPNPTANGCLHMPLLLRPVATCSTVSTVLPHGQVIPLEELGGGCGAVRRITCTRNPIAAPFDFSCTAAEVAAGIDLSGKRAAVTGGASTIGIGTARALAGSGVKATLAVRSTGAGSRVAADIPTTTANCELSTVRFDLTDLYSITARSTGWNNSLHILVNNAWIMAAPELERSPEGHELQSATNFLGQFALTTGPRTSLAVASGARVASVNVQRKLFLAGDLR